MHSNENLDAGNESDVIRRHDLRPKEAALLAALCGGCSMTAAAAAAGVSVHTAYRYWRRPGLRAALADAHAGLFWPEADSLRKQVTASIDRLVYLRDNARTESTQLRAAVSIIELAVKLHEMVDVQPRLAAIEAQLAEAEGDPDATDEDGTPRRTWQRW